MSTPNIAIVGAGFGGLAAAIELKRSGIDSFTIFERADEVGGVWQANSYPGAACDVPSVTYQFSFALNGSWSRRYGKQAEIRDYLRDASEQFAVRDHIRFGTAVEAASFDEDAGRWTVTLSGGERAEFDIVICATGQLSRPNIPDVPGHGDFQGEQFHSAEWNHDVDLRGKRVAVVGGGATAIQVVPAIVDETSHLTVVQRTPSWVVNKYDWSPIWLERVQPLQRAYHNLMWLWFESRYPAILRSSRPIRAAWEWQRKRTMKRILRNPQKVAAVTPDYQIGCNRLLLSREWYPTLAREDVSVIGEGVGSLTETGLVTSGGETVDADVIIWCTGFTASEYLAPMAVTGRDGLDVRDAWVDGPEAYLGMTTPGFPNMFMVYGPNTNSLTNTIVYLLERQAQYIRQAVEYLTARGGTVEVKREVHDAFNAELAERFQRTTFTTGCPGWYTTSSGKVVAVWVGSHVEYGRRTRRFDPAVFEHVAAPALAPSSGEKLPL